MKLGTLNLGSKMYFGGRRNIQMNNFEKILNLRIIIYLRECTLDCIENDLVNDFKFKMFQP